MKWQALFSVVPAAFAAAMACAAPDGAADRAAPIEQITVIAHKDERSIRDVAAHVTSLSRADLDDELATSIRDAFRYVPGVDYEGAGLRFGTEGINIRGIGVPYGLTNDGFEQGVGIYVDDVYYSRPASAVFDFLDVALVFRRLDERDELAVRHGLPLRAVGLQELPDGEKRHDQHDPKQERLVRLLHS